jgi:hypothetical protein
MAKGRDGGVPTPTQSKTKRPQIQHPLATLKRFQREHLKKSLQAI